MEAQKKMLVLIPTTLSQREYLEEKAEGYQVEYVSSRDLTKEQVEAAEIIVGNIPQSYLLDCKSLKWLQLNSAGANGYLGEVLPPEVLLTSSSGAYDLSVAEHMFAMLLSVYKRLYGYWDNQKQEAWLDLGKVKTLRNKTVLIVGAGKIGTTFAGMVKAFGAHTIGVKRTKGACPEHMDEIYQMDALHQLAARADVVISLLPGTAATERIYDTSFFQSMKKDAIFMNAGRGTAVCQEALEEALQQEQIGAAILDVTDPEPLPQGHSLWKCKNLYLTPHIAGKFHLDETLEAIVRITGENLERYKAGEPLKNLVDRAIGY